MCIGNGSRVFCEVEGIGTHLCRRERVMFLVVCWDCLGQFNHNSDRGKGCLGSQSKWQTFNLGNKGSAIENQSALHADC